MFVFRGFCLFLEVFCVDLCLYVSRGFVVVLGGFVCFRGF